MYGLPGTKLPGRMSEEMAGIDPLPWSGRRAGVTIPRPFAVTAGDLLIASATALIPA